MLQHAKREPTVQNLKLKGLLLVLLLPLVAVGPGAARGDPDRTLPADRGPAAAPDQALDQQRVETSIRQQTNQLRQEQGHAALKSDPQLAEAARELAEYMARTGRYGHTADDRRPAQRARDHGYRICLILENIAFRSHAPGVTADTLAEGFVHVWRDSPDHRRNLLDPDILDIGVGVAYDADNGNYYAVQKFGRPDEARVRFQVTNRSGTEVQYTLGPQQQGRTFTLPPRATRTHQGCRPAAVGFDWLEPDEAPRADHGDHLVVRRDAAGQFVIETQ